MGPQTPPRAHHTFSGPDKLHDKNKLLSAFQKCEEAVLAATEDCGDDEAGRRKTLELAAEVVDDMLGHCRLEEVRVRKTGGVRRNVCRSIEIALRKVFRLTYPVLTLCM